MSEFTYRLARIVCPTHKSSGELCKCVCTCRLNISVWYGVVKCVSRAFGKGSSKDLHTSTTCTARTYTWFIDTEFSLLTSYTCPIIFYCVVPSPAHPEVIRIVHREETASVTSENENEVATAVVGTSPAGSTTATEAAEAIQVGSTTNEGTTATIVRVGTIVTTWEVTKARRTIVTIEATTEGTTEPRTNATMMNTTELGGTLTFVLGAEARPGTTTEQEELEGRGGKLLKVGKFI